MKGFLFFLAICFLLDNDTGTAIVLFVIACMIDDKKRRRV